ncbi:MAG TPA: AAA family ATPase [Acidimicrobiales bacterium]|nr:AAA family ATPase [Acidimicrobiales bacterium]
MSEQRLRIQLCGKVSVDAAAGTLPDALLGGHQGRLALAFLVTERHRSVPREELAELLWSHALPNSWSASLNAVVSKVRRLLSEAGLDGRTALASSFGCYRLHLPDDAWVDTEAAVAAIQAGERALAAGSPHDARDAACVARDLAVGTFLPGEEGVWVDAQRSRMREIRVRALHCLAQAQLASDDALAAIEPASEVTSLEPFGEAGWRLLMRAHAAAGERAEALRAWERCRVLLLEELGTNPSVETEAVYLALLREESPDVPPSLPTGVVTFLLTEIDGSASLWERDPAAMTAALERHDRLIAHAVRAHGGTLIRARGDGDATFSVFRRPSEAACAALVAQVSLAGERWPGALPLRTRMAVHTGEAVERDGTYLGPTVNRAARLRALARGGQILVSTAVAEVTLEHLPSGAELRGLGHRHLPGLTRGEHVYELGPARSGAGRGSVVPEPLARPPLPGTLGNRGPFVGRDREVARLAEAWAMTIEGGARARAVFISGEPGVGKTRLAGEWARQAHQRGALVLYGRCDEDLGAPYQPFAEALRSLLPCLGGERLRALSGVEELGRLAPELSDVLPEVDRLTHADADTERYVLFDALVRLFAAVSAEVPVVLVLDDLHWAAKPTVLLLRHILRADNGARVLIVATYRSTELDFSHPLAGALADLHRDGTTERIGLAGLDVANVGAYLAAAGHDAARLAPALSTVTGGNPFFLIEVVRNVEESNSTWSQSTLPQGVREAVGRRLSRLSAAAREALLVGAVAGSRFSLAIVESVLGGELVDEIGDACHAGLVVEEPDGWFRFNHAIVRQCLHDDVASVKRMRLHRRIAEALAATARAEDDEVVADLAHHWFACATDGNAGKAVEACHRAGSHAMARLAYEEAADHWDRALRAAALDPGAASSDEVAALLVARCEALLAAGDVASASAAVARLEQAAGSSPRLAAWGACFAGQLAVLIHPERLADTEVGVAAAAAEFAAMGDHAGEAKAHTVHASCLARLGRIAGCEVALDRALTAARRVDDPRRVNAVLAAAPVAALWGPRPVARASGHCIELGRILQITTGSPAVEASAMCCHAVLESLRGRGDAARDILASAREVLEELGHTHGLLEADLFGGLVELFSEDAVAAEVPLRAAYEGYARRGAEADAAYAAALTARAVLAQGRVDEALAITADSERFAGNDLKAAIAWRTVRAEALAKHGCLREALDIARAAVALADVTDALIDRGDAHRSLAVVYRTGGNDSDADREAREAIDLYERKGATACGRSVTAAFGATTSGSAPVPLRPPVRWVQPNAATAAGLTGVFEANRLDEWADQWAADCVEVDHQWHLSWSRDRVVGLFRQWSNLERVTVDGEVLASLGARHALKRVVVRHRGATVGASVAHTGRQIGPAVVDFLRVLRTDVLGRMVRVERFAMDDLNLALARLIELHADDELPGDQRGVRYRCAAQVRNPMPSWGGDPVVGRGDPDRDGPARIVDVIGMTERFFLLAVRFEARPTDPGGTPSALMFGEMDDDARWRRVELYLPEQHGDALARFTQLVDSAI